VLTDGMTEAERFQLLVRILDPADYLFLRSQNPSLEKLFRRKRARIFRSQLHVIAADSARLYRERAGNIAAAGRWSAYPALTLETISGFLAIAKLYFAGVLFGWRLPVLINAAKNADRVLRFVISERFGAAPRNQPV
jgi:hypothetical protein